LDVGRLGFFGDAFTAIAHVEAASAGEKVAAVIATGLKCATSFLA
jgi:hypothetical protein